MSSHIANETVGTIKESRPLSAMLILTNIYFLYGVSLLTFFVVWDRVAALKVFDDSLARP